MSRMSGAARGIVDVSCQDLLEVVEGLLAARPEAAAAARAGVTS